MKKEAEFRRKSWRAHSLLAGVPLHTLERIELPGGRAGMTLREISAVTGFDGEVEMEIGPIAKGLFWLRGLIGRILGWDDVPELVESTSFLPRLSPEDRARSLIIPGTPAGISRILYQFQDEMLGEIINRTVHCFWLMATERTSQGYALYFAVYVRKINFFTPIYMALVAPMLKWIIYPAMMRDIRRRWARAFPAMTGPPLASRS